MADKSADRYRALLIPDVRISADSIWAAQSTYTEAEPRPDVPVTSAGHMTLDATGEVYDAQEAETLTVRTQRAGMPGIVGSRGGFVWQNTGDALYRGWDAPSIISYWEGVEYTDGGGSYLEAEAVNPHAITLSDETVLVAYERVAVASTTRDVRIRSRHRSTGAWSVLATPYTGATTGDTLYPCLCLLPSGRVLLFHWVEDTVNNEGQVRMHYSDDAGANWSVGSAWCLDASVDISGSAGSGTAGYALGRLRAIYAGGNICLVSDLIQNDTDPTDRDVFQQWVSTDLGASFQTVGNVWDGETAGDKGGKFCNLLEISGEILLVFISRVYSSRPRVRRIGSAFDPFETVTGVQIAADTWATSTTPSGTGALIASGDLAAWVDPTGTIYVLGRRPSDDNEGIICESRDTGETWTELGSSDVTNFGKVWDFSDSTTYPNNFCATPQGGRAMVLHNWAANPGNEDNSLGALYLGGYTTVPMAFHAYKRTPENQTTFQDTWLPFELPGDLTTWTKTGSGSEALSAGALVLAAGASTAIAYETNPAGTATEGIVCRFSVLVNAGGSLTANKIATRIRVANGTTDHDISIRFVAGQFRVYDENGSATVATVTTSGYSAGTEIFVAFNKDRLLIWYRARDNDPDREWINAVNSASMTNNAVSPEANSSIKFGRPGPADSTADCDWFEFHHSSDEYTGMSGVRLTDNLTNPDDIPSRDFTNSAQYVKGGIKIRTIDGPAFAAETHTVGVRHDFALARCLPGGSESPSPRIRWRSQDETEHTIALYLSPSALAATENSYDLNAIIGVGLFGINFKEATFQGYDTGSTSWVDLITLDAADGMEALRWERRGNTVRPSIQNDTTPEPYFDADEFAGGTFNFGSTARKIQAHSEGAWSDEDDAKRLTRLILEGVDGTEGSSGSSGAVWAPSVIGTYTKQDAQYSGYRIKIAASQGTADGYYEIGSIVIGPVFVFADSYSFGRSIETETNVEVTEGRDWTKRSRVLSPARRIVEFGWAEGVDEFAYSSQTADPEPDYVATSTTANTLPVGSKGETPRQMEGYLRQIDGSHTPVVYLARLEKSTDSSTDAQVYNRRRDFVLGRIDGAIRQDTVMGEESVDEVVRVSKVTLIEEV